MKSETAYNTIEAIIRDSLIVVLAQYIDSIIMLLVGAYASAVGFGAIAGPSKDPVAGQQWFARYGKLFRVIGPLLIVIALILAAGKFFGLG